MYIYPSSPESASSLQSEESAAIKIQAGFRGYRVRKQLYRLNKSGAISSSSSSSSGNRSKSHLAHRQSGSRPGALRRQQQQQQRAMEERLQQDGQQKGGQSVEDRCATKIQAGFRGFLVRKKQKIATDAAVKIQSSFRGFKARKDAEKMKQT